MGQQKVNEGKEMSFDVEIAARTLWMEFRGEGAPALQAGAWAIVNRHNAGKWYSGHTLAECCLIAYQFSSWNSTDPNRIAMARLDDADPLLQECRSYMLDALANEGSDPTDGATNYYSTDIVLPPAWAATATFTVQIGKTRFFKNVN